MYVSFLLHIIIISDFCYEKVPGVLEMTDKTNLQTLYRPN